MTTASYASGNHLTAVGLNEKSAAETAVLSNDESLDSITPLLEPSGHHGSTPSPPQYSANLNHMLRGRVTYRDHTVRISTDAVDDQFIQNLGALIRRISGDEPARRVPSHQECRFCDISAADCPQRVEESSQPETGETFDVHVAPNARPVKPTAEISPRNEVAPATDTATKPKSR